MTSGKDELLDLLERSGDDEAMDSLFILSLDMKNDMYNQALKDNILSVVDTTMMPYGIDCEVYEIIGIIISHNTVKNNLTNEEIVHMTLLCNDYYIDLYINSMDLKGEPGIGRRFKGIVWLQGYVNF